MGFWEHGLVLAGSYFLCVSQRSLRLCGYGLYSTFTAEPRKTLRYTESFTIPTPPYSSETKSATASRQGRSGGNPMAGDSTQASRVFRGRGAGRLRESMLIVSIVSQGILAIASASRANVSK